MVYSKGNFYTDSEGTQIIDDVSIENCTLIDCEAENLGTSELSIGDEDSGIYSVFAGTEVPDVTTLAPAGSLYVCTTAGSIGLYLNIGTAATPVWKAVTLTS